MHILPPLCSLFFIFFYGLHGFSPRKLIFFLFEISFSHICGFLRSRVSLAHASLKEGVKSERKKFHESAQFQNFCELVLQFGGRRKRRQKKVENDEEKEDE